MSTTLRQDELWNLVAEHLSATGFPKLEWSLQLTKDSCEPRKYPLFWVGQLDEPTNKASFQSMYNLLKDLDCPDPILQQQQLFSTNSITQGIRLSLKSNKYCLYIDHKTGGTRRKDAFKWKGEEVLEKENYEYFTLSSPEDIKEPLQHIHPALQSCFEQLCLHPQILGRSGYTYKLHKGEVKETYLTFPWHPTLGSFKHYFPEYQLGSQAYGSFEHMHFRHLSFPTINDVDAPIAVYFGAPVRNQWPTSMESMIHEVEMGAAELHAQLREFMPCKSRAMGNH